MDEASELRVECHAGYRADERPLRFFLGDRPVEVMDVRDLDALVQIIIAIANELGFKR